MSVWLDGLANDALVTRGCLVDISFRNQMAFDKIVVCYYRRRTDRDSAGVVPWLFEHVRSSLRDFDILGCNWLSVIRVNVQVSKIASFLRNSLQGRYA